MLFCSVAFAQNTTFVMSVSDDDTTVYSPYNLSFGGSGVEVTDPDDGTATITISAGTTVTGTNTYVCFYDGSAASCSDAGISYVKATDILTVKGGVIFSDGTNKNITAVTINRADTDAKIEWDEANDEFDFNYPINVGGTSNTITFSNGATIINTDASNLDITETNIGLDGIVTFTRPRCVYYENVVSGDDNKSMGSFGKAATIENIWCQFSGTGTTAATLTLEDGSGNAMTITDTNPTCTAEGTPPTKKAVTAANTLTETEMLRFNVTNTPDPVTDDYTICVDWK